MSHLGRSISPQADALRSGLAGTPSALAVFVVAVAAAYVLLGLATLAVFPRVWLDEPWYTQSAWSFLQNGTFALPMFADLAGFDRDNVVYGRAYLLGIAAGFEVAGVGPFGARLASFISALVALGALFGIGRELWDRRTGLIAVLLLAVAPPFVLQSHDARPELMLIAAWTLAFYLCISGERTGARWRLLLGGLLATLAADTHLNGAVVPAAIFVVLLYRRVERRMLASYILGAIAGSAWWLWAHIVPDPQLFIEQVTAYSRGAPFLEVLSRPVYVFGTEIFRYILVEPRGSLALLLLAVIAGSILLVKHRDRSLMSLLIFSSVVFLFMALTAGSRTPIYAVLLWPVFALLAGRLMALSSRRMAIVATSLVVLVSVSQVGLVALRDAPADYDGYIAKLRAVVPSGAKVQGQEPTWYGFSDHPFIGSHYFLFARPYGEEIRRLGIEYIMADEYFLRFQLHEMKNIDAGEVEPFLATEATLVAEVEDSHYGWTQHGGGEPPYVTRVYRVNEPVAGSGSP